MSVWGRSVSVGATKGNANAPQFHNMKNLSGRVGSGGAGGSVIKLPRHSADSPNAQPGLLGQLDQVDGQGLTKRLTMPASKSLPSVLPGASTDRPLYQSSATLVPL